MAEPREDGEKTVVIPQMPTSITATQVIAIVLCLAAFQFARDVLAPLLLGILTAVALAPLVRGLSRVMPRWIAAAVVVIAIAGAFGFTAWALSDEVAAFSRRLPSLVREIRTAVQSASPRQSLIRQLQQAVTELEKVANRGHSLTIDSGWHEVADRALAFVKRFAGGTTDTHDTPNHPERSFS